MTLATLLLGQVLAADNELGSWIIGSTQGALGVDDDRWRFHVDGQGRFVDPGSGATQYLLRPSVGRKLSGGITAWLGFGRFETRAANGARSFENRYWQQLTWAPRPLWQGSVSYRVRLEQRFISSGNDDGMWIRFLARYEHPLRDASPHRAYLGVESFFDLRDTDWSGDAGLRQGRVLFGVGWQLSARTRLDTGYMNQYLIRDDRDNRSNHLLTLQLRYRY